MPLDLVGLREETEVVPTLWICKKLKELRCMSRRVCRVKARAQPDPQGHVLCP